MSLVKLRQIESGDILWFKDGSVNATANWNLGGFQITNLGNPTHQKDAATKEYVDARVQGLTIKSAVKVATTTNITLSGTQTIDGVALSAGDRVLVKNQTTGSENGIYLVSATAWTRASDAVDGVMSANDFCFASQGTTQHDTGWVLTTDNPIIVGTTSLTYTQFSGAGSYTNGTGIALTGNVFSLNANLDDLNDVEISSPLSKHVLRHNGTKWVNSILSYNDLSNIPTIPTVNDGALTLGIAAGSNLTGSASFTANQSSASTFTVGVASGYAIPSSTDIANWNTAYGWGNHASAGYALSGHTHVTSSITALTGYTLGTNTAIAATDTLNAALGKIQAQISARLSSVGTLKTDNTTAQSTAPSESFTGAISLHKIAKTGTYSDLIGTPTIPTIGTLDTTTNKSSGTQLTGQASESFGSSLKLHVISKTGLFTDLKGVNITSPVDGQTLVYSGGILVNQSPASSTVTLSGAVTGTGSTGSSIVTTLTDTAVRNVFSKFRFTNLTGTLVTLSGGIDFTRTYTKPTTLQIFLNGVLQDCYVGVPGTPSDYDCYIDTTIGVNKIQFTTALVSTDILIIMGIF